MNTLTIVPSVCEYLAARAAGNKSVVTFLINTCHAVGEEFAALTHAKPGRAFGSFVGESISNAFSASRRNALRDKVGLTHAEFLLLKYPSDERDRLNRRIARVLGLPYPADQCEIRGALGLLDPPPVVIALAADDTGESWEASMANYGTLGDEDRREIQRRIDNPAGVRREVDALRELHRRPNGRVSIPTTTGGGALGVVVTVSAAKEEGLFFGYESVSEPRPATRLFLRTRTEVP